MKIAKKISILDNNEIQKFIAVEAFNDSSLLAVSAIDLSTREVIYANKAMKHIMADLSAKKCWESIHGQNKQCSWCKADNMLQNNAYGEYIIYEHFNEVANSWYQLQDKIIKLKDGTNILISFALDISVQKEAQSQLIETHVKLSQQTEALRNAQKKLKEQANHDPLTNLYNRRYFNDISEKIIALTKRKKEPLSLIMIDIDNFKNVNDTYGHNVGDEVIKLLANRLMDLSRESDISARFGGEEFAIILPNTNLAHALNFAEKIRANIETATVKYKNKNIMFTISIGVDEFEYDSDKTVSSSLNRADRALYMAKNSGKNRVCSL
jgi:diguanylate cyclase (GGDEF)-like protein